MHLRDFKSTGASVCCVKLACRANQSVELPLGLVDSDRASSNSDTDIPLKPKICFSRLDVESSEPQTWKFIKENLIATGLPIQNK